MNGFDVLVDGLGVFSRPTVLGLISWIICWVFLYSGAAKLWHPIPAAIAMARFGVVRAVNQRDARVVGAAEASLAIACVAPPRRAALVALAALSWAFVLMIGRSLARGDRFPCACFGVSGKELSARTLARSTVLAVLATTAAGVSWRTHPPGALPAVVASAATALAMLATLGLTVSVPDLLRWNRNSLSLFWP